MSFRKSAFEIDRLIGARPRKGLIKVIFVWSLSPVESFESDDKGKEYQLICDGHHLLSEGCAIPIY